MPFPERGAIKKESSHRHFLSDQPSLSLRQHRILVCKPQTRMADDLYNLELLSLIARITQEIYNYIAVNDKVLAEYVVSLHEQSSSANDFKVKLNGALPDSAIENIDRLILSLHPKHKKKSKELANILVGSDDDAHGQIEADKQKRLFPGLSLPDQEVSKDVLMQEVDDMMAQFEGAAKKSTRVERTEESLTLPQRRDRSRPRSPPRRRSRSPDRGRSHDTKRDYRHGGRDRMPFDERPVLFKIYSGRISGLKDFGAFVQVEGVSGRVEGKHSLWKFFLFSLCNRHGARLKHPARRPCEFCFGFTQQRATGQSQGYECRRESNRSFHERCRPSHRP